MIRSIQPPVLWTLAGILVALITATLLSQWLKRANPNKDYSELVQRVNSWWWMAGIFALAVALNVNVAIGFFTFLSFLALKEYLSLIPTRRADRRVLFWCYLAIPIHYYWVYDRWYELFVIWIPVWMFMLVSARMVMIGDTKDFLRAVGTLQWGMLTMVFALSHLAYLLVLPERIGQTVGGAGLVLFVVLLTQLNDVAQYVWGKSFGRNKITPTVSPKKTAEGLLGGVLTTTAVAVWLAPILTPLSPAHSIAVGLIIGIGGFLGDVTISALKRDLNVKDSGSLIPGHGGILDRVDSLTFTAPLFFHFMKYFYY
ncbi:MAG: phosphatidate cytidylyltransferase [Proteobacteria bacterium]|nr:phosphatidate cytidylyltransferase [Pseudomonadota bacterium]